MTGVNVTRLFEEVLIMATIHGLIRFFDHFRCFGAGAFLRTVSTGSVRLQSRARLTSRMECFPSIHLTQVLPATTAVEKTDGYSYDEP